jgi:hypothetical protein
LRDAEHLADEPAILRLMVHHLERAHRVERPRLEAVLEKVPDHERRVRIGLPGVRDLGAAHVHAGVPDGAIAPRQDLEETARRAADLEHLLAPEVGAGEEVPRGVVEVLPRPPAVPDVVLRL